MSQGRPLDLPPGVNPRRGLIHPDVMPYGLNPTFLDQGPLCLKDFVGPQSSADGL
jgi:hypothetical protein